MSEPMMLGAITNTIIRALPNPDAVLAEFPRKRALDDLRDDQAYPLSLSLELCDYLEQRLGVYAFLRTGRKIGKVLMDTSYGPELRSVADAIAQMQVAHQALCEPAIGSIDLVESRPGFAAIRYTASFNCILQEGLFYELALRYGAQDATVTHSECRRKGADACRFEIRYRDHG